MAAAKALPILPFASVLLFEAWLSTHLQTDGAWIQIAKKVTGVPSVSYDEALDIALCYGWIDGQRNSYDATYFLQKFAPRRPQSLWSKRAIAKVVRLTTEGKMQPPGLAEVRAAQQDGRWEAAYASSKNVAFPEDFLEALEKNNKAQVFFNTLSKSQVYAIAARLVSAKKPETRQQRFAALLVMLEQGEFH